MLILTLAKHEFYSHNSHSTGHHKCPSPFLDFQFKHFLSVTNEPHENKVKSKPNALIFVKRRRYTFLFYRRNSESYTYVLSVTEVIYPKLFSSTCQCMANDWDFTSEWGHKLGTWVGLTECFTRCHLQSSRSQTFHGPLEPNSI